MKRAGRWAARPLERQPGPPREVVAMPTGHVLYAVNLSAAPSLAWRAAFLRPPARLQSVRGTPDVGRLELRGATVHFRTTPRQRDAWLRRLDRWIRYANSVVAE